MARLTGYQLHSQQLFCDADRQNLTIIPAFTATATAIDAAGAATNKRRLVRLQHHLKEVYSVVVDDIDEFKEIVVEERETLVGEKVVVDVIPSLILVAIMELLKGCVDQGRRVKWGKVLDQALRLIYSVDVDVDDDGDGDGNCVLITLDFVSYEIYRCFEEADESM